MRILIFTILVSALMNLPSVFAQKEIRIRDVNFEGNREIDDRELLDQINTRPKKGLAKILFWKKRPDFIPSVLRDDIGRLVSYYNRNGFLNPVITHELDPSRSGKLVRINIRVEENEFVKVDSIGISLDGDTSTRRLIDLVRSEIPLNAGQRFADEDVFGTIDMLKRSFSNNGYPFVSAEHDITLKDSNQMADVVFTVSTGEKSFFGDIAVEGDSLVTEKFIRKYLLFDKDELYSQKKIDSTQQDIFNTDLFQYVVIASLKDSVENNRIPVNILVKELPRWSLETGVGYGTEDKLRLAAQVTRLNFLGGSRRLVVNAKTSYFLPFSFDVRFVQPDFLIQRLDLVINPFYLREREISYRIDRSGGSINFLYPSAKNVTTNVSYAFEHDRILELTDLQLDSSELKHNKSIFSIGNQLNSANDPFYPSKGFRLFANFSYAGLGYKKGAQYYKIGLSLVNYFSLDDRTVLATRLSTGVVRSVRQSVRTPIEERFLLGGANSLRGWGRHRISTVVESGFTAGGNTMFEGSLELRFPVYDILHGAVFMDAGNVWVDSYEYGFDRLHYDSGLGLRVRTPIGPLRLDFATPVINDGFNFQFFISVGHAF